MTPLKRFLHACIPCTVLIIIVYTPVYAGITGKATFDVLVDNNVYNDYRNLSDVGMDALCVVNYLGKLGDAVYPRINFEYETTAFPSYNLENQNTTILSGILKILLGDMLTANIETGSDVNNLPFQTQYSTSLLYVIPSLRVYPTAFTEVEAGLMNNNVTYPNYDLDYTGNKTYVRIEQELPLDVSLKLIGTTGDRTYSERLLYDMSSTTYPAVSSEYRYDTELSYSLKLEQYITVLGDVAVSYAYEKLDSTDNEFSWGPQQTESDNTTGDEQLLSNFWDYELTRISISMKPDITPDLNFSFSFTSSDKLYAGWLARDETEAFLSPEESRHDVQQNISVGFEKSIRNAIAVFSITFITNDSNDYPYDYTENSVKAGVKYLF